MKFKTIVQVTRAPFFLAPVSSVLVGAALGWYEGTFHWGYLILTVIGIMCINGGLNMSNDYYDHVLGSDNVNQNLTPFSGGSRSIQQGILSPRQVLSWSLAFYVVGAAIGVYLAATRGWPILWLGLAGLFVAFFSSAPPISLNYLGHGLGELATYLGCGPLAVLGSYYVQAQRLSWEAVWVSIPVGLLGAALIWINEFPDYEADKAVGKDTLVVVLGKARAVWGYIGLIVGVYVFVIAGTLAGFLPYAVLLVLLTVPLAYKSILGAKRFYEDTPKLIPTSAATIQLYLANALLFCASFALARWIV